MSNSDQSQLVVLSGIHASRLGNDREVYIYLPVGYDDDYTQRYPVLYMHVGQHVFNPRKESGESWNMHRVADRLIAGRLIEPLIIVAVEHKFEEGTSEYFHDLCAYPIRCLGEDYEHFLIEELKPLVDRSFRTLPEAEHTGLMGSSAAGIATYNIGLRNPDVFGMLGILSPFFVKVEPYTLEEMEQYRLYPLNEGQKIWLDIGGAEGFFMPSHVKEVAEEMLRAGWRQEADLYYFEERDAAHSERDWGRRAHLPLIHFFGGKGEAVKVELQGDDTVGVEGPELCINAVVTLDNEFSFSDLAGSYRSDHPEILEAAPSGLLLPKQPGTATITYSYGGLEASRTYTVVEELSETVDIEIEIHVPEFTPDDDVIYATFNVPRISKGLYGSEIKLPRGMTFDFLITRGYDKDEVDLEFGQIPYRRLVADKDKKVSYTVSNWIDLKPINQLTKEEY
ncbi:esterase family protein [Paenibacillus oenotherae]|uniref:Esterase family protein n=1 Tax=Paenibacillus oenotherae TaxID=1435645 RepID=A0ABS7DA81_9BACL|nr:alpha/beta hydrolase-fold protein [Paenibacillus oenotherae]MBW7476849.1 esterase family protein [Paenibacillus oenotherae]